MNFYSSNGLLKKSRKVNFNNKNKMRKLLKYLFQRPNVKVGDKLSYYDKTCKRIYFSWEHGIWFIQCEDVTISWVLEQFYRERN